MSRPLLAFIALLLALGLVGFLFKERVVAAFPELARLGLTVNITATPSPMLTPTPFISMEAVSSPMVESSPSMTPQPGVTPSPAAKTPVVVFTPDGIFTAQVKSKIMQRIVNPFIDYELDHPGQSKVLTINISENTQASKNQFPYLFEAIYENGGTRGFVIAPQGDSFQWYVPEGMGGCQLTAAYKQKYPEIAKLCGE